jgi:hypothetical protein
MSSNPFDPTSRYFTIPTAEYAAPDGRSIVYLTRRFLPDRKKFVLLERAQVTAADRLDLLAERYLGDPLQFWRIADCNAALNPLELMSNPGGTVDVCLPQEMSGGAYT